MPTAFSNDSTAPKTNPSTPVTENPAWNGLTKESFEELGITSEQFRNLFSHSSDGVGFGKIIYKDGQPADYFTLEINDAYEMILGVKRADFIGNPITQALPGIDKDLANLINFYGQVATTGKTAKREIFFQVYGKYYQVTAYSPKKDYFITIFSDITEGKENQIAQEMAHKKAEEAVRASEERFRSVLESSLDVIYRFNLKTGHYEYMSPAIRALGFEPDEMVSMSNEEVFSRVHPEDLPILRLALARLAESGRSYAEYRFMGKDGVYRWWSNQMILIKGEDGMPLYRDGDVRDISENKKTSESLEKMNAELDNRVQQRTKELSCERERLFSVLEVIPAMVILLTADYKVAFANRSFKEKFGESNGRYCYDFCFGNKAPCSFCETYTVLETGKPHRWQVNAPDGTVIDAYDYPFTDTDGTKMILEMELDITEQKKLEKHLKDAERLAAIGATAGMVGHDIRNPLQAMMSDVYLLKSMLEDMPHSETKAEVVESLDGLEKNIGYVNKIVADLQDYARPLKPEYSIIDIPQVVSVALKTVALPENIKLVLDVKAPNKLKSEATFIQRSLTNLVNNAIQAMPDGGTLTVTVEESDAKITFSVKDTGMGIPEEVKAKIFSPMTTTKSKGQGLGLAVVKRLTEALGGSVSFESQAGNGATFMIQLPMTQPTK